MRTTCEFSEEGADSQSSDSDEGKSALLDRDGTLVGGRHEEQEGGDEHGADTEERQGQADSRRCQEVDSNACEYLDGEEEVVEALMKGHFLGGLGGLTVHAEDGQGARRPREGLDVEDEDVEGGGQEGRDHSEDQHRGIFRKRSTECTPNYSRQAQINMGTAARL